MFTKFKLVLFIIFNKPQNLQKFFFSFKHQFPFSLHFLWFSWRFYFLCILSLHNVCYIFIKAWKFILIVIIYILIKYS